MNTTRNRVVFLSRACQRQAQKLIAVQRTRLAVARQVVWFIILVGPNPYDSRAQVYGLTLNATQPIYGHPRGPGLMWRPGLLFFQIGFGSGNAS